MITKQLELQQIQESASPLRPAKNIKSKLSFYGITKRSLLALMYRFLSGIIQETRLQSLVHSWCWHSLQQQANLSQPEAKTTYVSNDQYIYFQKT